VPTDAANRSQLDKIGNVFSNSVSAELRRVRLERALLKQSLAETHTLAEHMKKLSEASSSVTTHMAKQLKALQAYSVPTQALKFDTGSSLAPLFAKQMQELQRAEQASMRRLLGPFQGLRSALLNDSAFHRMVQDLQKPNAQSERFTKLFQQATGSASFRNRAQSDLLGSIERAQRILADASVGSSVSRLLKSFEDVNKRWVVPQPLLDAIGALQAMQQQMPRLSLPVIDTASALTLARVLGAEGIRSQLEALGINPDGSANVQVVQHEEGIGLSRKTLELMTLLSLFLAVLMFFYQEIGSSRWQAATDQTLTGQTERIDALGSSLDAQLKTIESLTKLVERAIVQEARRHEVRFVVLDRVATVRSKPQHGSAVHAKLFPREVVRPVSEHGKWIQFEYYHWLHQEHRTGWALKKYFQRVPANFDKPAK